MNEPRVIDAYRYPQKVRAGCQHQLGCGCDPPFWLRASSPAEQAREFRPPVSAQALPASDLVGNTEPASLQTPQGTEE